ncbi:hypothetical protein [Bacillus sp. FJAT-45066]|uniref:hypothetical protein n=1 Tax=Bacillus sp. FJAT-45066 TaxID=2011010 RepID=UPI000BB6D123|nr:hypothetical protein [Bacillus sp. FJAT-45066]
MSQKADTNKVFPSSIKKQVVISLITLFVICAIVFSFYIYKTIHHQDIVNTETVLINEVKLEHQHLHISGDTIYSAIFFTRDYEIKYDGEDTLYVQLMYQRTDKNNASGRFDIHFYFGGEFSNVESTKINKVYLQGKDPEDVRLIWER